MFPPRSATGGAVLLLLLQLCTTARAETSSAEEEFIQVGAAAAAEPEKPSPASQLSELLKPENEFEAVRLLDEIDFESEVAKQLPVGERLSLREALERALSGNAELRSLEYEGYAAQARILQGSLKPNPEFEAEISEFLGTAEMEFFRSAVTGVGISQLIERGEKRCARMAVAEKELAVTEFDKKQTRLDLMLQVSRAYYAVLVAQEKLKLAAEQELLARQVHNVVQTRVEAGQAAKLELNRTDLDLANVQLDLKLAKSELAAAGSELAAIWGQGEPDFGMVEGELELPAEPPGIEQLSRLLEGTPDALRWEAEAELRRARRDLAQAEGVPDITFSGGIERFEESDSFGLRFGVSIPLPRNNHNEGNVVEAQDYVEQVASLKEAELRHRTRELTAVYNRMAIAFERAALLQETVLPAAKETFDLTRYGYLYGKFGILDVLDVSRTLLDARARNLDALSEYQLAAVELERLIAQPLEALENTQTLEPGQEADHE